MELLFFPHRASGHLIGRKYGEPFRIGGWWR